jgi:hypothetical protein
MFHPRRFVEFPTSLITAASALPLANLLDTQLRRPIFSNATIDVLTA